MILTDVNVLLEAFYPGAKRHGIALRLLVGLLNRPEPFAWHSAILSAVVRISTNRAAFPAPATLDEAFAFCGSITEAENSIAVEPNASFWPIFEGVVKDHRISGRKTTDAYFAALAIHSGCTWVTWDRDFMSIKGLSTSSPENAISEFEA